MSKSVCFINLGCKVNKYENECMASLCKDAGYRIVGKDEKPDYFVINSCAVTNESEKKSRQEISKVLSLNPNAKIVVVGCASGHDPEQFRAKPNVIAVGGAAHKDTIVSMLDGISPDMTTPTVYEDLENPLIEKTRAYMKIQDGCNNFCNYCIIPYVRGRSRSRNFEKCILEAANLSRSFPEIVITGIDTSSFKDGDRNLFDLIYALRDLPCRIRISSLEVGVITEENLAKVASATNFCPHFHLSMQSGSDSVLARMNRHYTSGEYLDKVKLIRKYFPDCNITTDVIVGYNMETEKEFRDTIRVCKRAKFGYIHIFPYSKKSGTVAAKLQDLPNNIKHDRVKRLEVVRDKLQRKYLKSKRGKTYSVVFEDMEGEYTTGYTPNYIKVYVLGSHTGTGKVKLGKIFNGGVKGEIING